MQSLLTTSNSEWDFCYVSGKPVHELYTQIQAQLSSEPVLAQLLSEPVIDHLHGKIEWITQLDGSVDGCFIDLAADKQQMIRDKLASLYDKINQRISILKSSENQGASVMAEALEMALNIPIEEFIYSVNGEPVLVGWGHRAPGVIANPFVLKQLCRQSPTNGPTAANQDGSSSTGSDSSVDSQTSSSDTSRFGGEGATDRGQHHHYDGNSINRNTHYYYETVTYARNPLASVLCWIMVGVLFLTIFWLLLRNCALGLPGVGWLANYCPPTAVVSESNQLSDLETKLQSLQEDIARAQLDCSDSNESLPRLEDDNQSTESEPHIEDNQSAENNTSVEAVERVLEEGGAIKAVNIILSWYNEDDLDLHLVCPDDGRISHEQIESCGGALDVDMNANSRSLSMNPVENIVFAEGSATAGEYHIEVVLYSDREPVGAGTDFQVQLLIGGEVIESVNDSISEAGQVKRLISFNLPHNSSGN